MPAPLRHIGARVSRRLGPLAASVWIALVLLWLVDVNGPSVARWLSRALAILAVALTSAGLWRLRRFLSPEHRPQGPLLLGLLAAGVVLGMSGLGHEVGKGYNAYGRWLRPENADRPWGDWYRRLFESHRLVHDEEPGPWRRGPYLRLYGIERPEERVRKRTFLPEEAFLSHPSMDGKSELRFTHHGRRAVFSEAFEAGRYRIEAKGRFRPAIEARLGGAGAEVEIARPGKLFVEVSWPKGSRMRRLAIVRLE